MRLLSLLAFVFIFSFAQSQQRKEALFLGNSYTQYNSLPQLVADVALSLGDTLVFDSNLPGGYTFEGHSTNATSLSKIAQQAWDFVVLQEQSQRPAFSQAQVAADVYPFADSLCRIIRENDSCTVPLFYMTWGRKNGDASNCASYPPICTYVGMQQRLRESYLEMGQMFSAEVAAVGSAWKQTRDSLPLIELYNPDESHPSLHGSYLAACIFYASIFKSPSLGATFPGGITAQDAQDLQEIADRTVLDSLSTWYMDTSTVQAFFSYTVQGNGLEIQFTNTSQNASSYAWDFGDGVLSDSANPVHIFSAAGTYYVQLISNQGCKSDTFLDSLALVLIGNTDEVQSGLQVYPNPTQTGWNVMADENSSAGLSLEMYSLSGQLIWENEIGHATTFVPGEDLPAGLYLLKWNSERQQGSVLLQKMGR